MSARSLSLFSGGGGLDLGLGAALGLITVGQVELEPYKRAILAREWPDAEQATDVLQVRGDEFGELALVKGGSPCQDLSLPGPRTGLEGARSARWFDMARIIGVASPTWVCWENVGGALCAGYDEDGNRTHPGIRQVLRDLHDRDYDAFWTTMTASQVGARHRRVRVFLLGWRRGDPRRVAFRQRRDPRLDLSGRNWPAGPGEPAHPSEPPRQLRSSTLVSNFKERIGIVGDCVVPQCGWVAGRVLAHLEEARQRGHLQRLEGRSLPARELRRLPAPFPGTPTELARLLSGHVLRLVLGDSPLALAQTHALSGDYEPEGPWPLQGFCLRGSVTTPKFTFAPALHPNDAERALTPELWPTPTVRDSRSGRSGEATRQRNARPLSERAAPTGYLNPDRVDLMGGFQAGYSALTGDPAR